MKNLKILLSNIIDMVKKRIDIKRYVEGYEEKWLEIISKLDEEILFSIYIKAKNLS